VVQTTALSGTGVAWFLLTQFLQHQKLPQVASFVTSLLDLVCLATLVDQVPQRGLNRLLVRQGLLQLRRSKRVGLQALAQVANIDLAKVTGQKIGFGLGPRLNAIGRLSDSLDALRLLCTASDKLALKLARTLQAVNSSRQELTATMTALALAQVDEQRLPPLIIVSSEEFHEGIIGLLASKLSEKFSRPAIAIATRTRVCKASCRSLADFNITDFLSLVQTDLLDFGGHALAAGFSVAKDKVATLKKKLLQLAATKINPEKLAVLTPAEAIVALPVLTDPGLERLLAVFEPFGAGNNEPLIQTSGEIISRQLLGDRGQHLKLILRCEQSKLTVLAWNSVLTQDASTSVGRTLTVLGTPKFESYRGCVTPTLFFSRLVTG
jgi:single-stranded-DNA-specific exonuclease